MSTFFKDWKCLNAASVLMEELVPIGEVSRLICDNLHREAYTTGDRCVVQLAENTYTFVSCGGAAGAEVARRQLWLAALRHSRATTERGSATEPPERLRGLANLAEILGLELGEAGRIRSSSLHRRAVTPVESIHLGQSSFQGRAHLSRTARSDVPHRHAYPEGTSSIRYGGRTSIDVRSVSPFSAVNCPSTSASSL